MLPKFCGVRLPIIEFIYNYIVGFLLIYGGVIVVYLISFSSIKVVSALLNCRFFLKYLSYLALGSVFILMPSSLRYATMLLSIFKLAGYYGEYSNNYSSTETSDTPL